MYYINDTKLFDDFYTPKAVLFDLDGTLIDTERVYRYVYPIAIKELGYEMTDEMMLSLRSLGKPFAHERYVKWYGEDFPFEEFKEKRNAMFDAILEREGIKVKPGVDELLEYLKSINIRVAIATATRMDRTIHYLKMAHLDDRFEQVISAYNVKVGKPAPDVYLYACESLGLKPCECIAVEDAPNGAHSAAAAGCNVIFVPDQTKADKDIDSITYAVCDSLSDIKDILMRKRNDRV